MTITFNPDPDILEAFGIFAVVSGCITLVIALGFLGWVMWIFFHE